MSGPLRLATRTSKLALAQADIVAAALAPLGIASRVVGVETTGDADRTSSVAALTEMGAFVRSVQQAVLDGRADLAVHSGKDLPVAGPPELAQFHLERAPTADVLCGLDNLSVSGRIGTGSPRRRAQLALLAPGFEIVEVRGNVETRLARTGHDLDAVVLAEAGLTRLDLIHRIDRRFDPAEMVPAPAQGAITVEAMEGSGGAEALRAVEHAPTRRTVGAERHLLELTGAGCRSALGALASHNPDGSLTMVGFIEDERGARHAETCSDEPHTVADSLRSALGLE